MYIVLGMFVEIIQRWVECGTNDEYEMANEWGKNMKSEEML